MRFIFAFLFLNLINFILLNYTRNFVLCIFFIIFFNLVLLLKKIIHYIQYLIKRFKFKWYKINNLFYAYWLKLLKILIINKKSCYNIIRFILNYILYMNTFMPIDFINLNLMDNLNAESYNDNFNKYKIIIVVVVVCVVIYYIYVNPTLPSDTNTPNAIDNPILSKHW